MPEHIEFKKFRNGYYEHIKTSDSYNDYLLQNDIPITFDKEKELSEHELYAIWFFTQNAYTGSIITHNTAKTEFEVRRDGVSDVFILTSANQNPKRCDIVKYMELFEKSFQMKTEICQMKNKLKSEQVK